MEILGNGRLIVNGGDKTNSKLNAKEGSGAGGIIQIISPMGNLSAESLSLRQGTGSTAAVCLDQSTEAHGYYYLQGKSIQRSLMRSDNFPISSSTVLSIFEPGYQVHTHI